MIFFKLFLSSLRPFRSFRVNRAVGFRRICLAVICLLWLGALAARATDRYVSPYGTNDSAHGYTNWVGAATNIQDAVSITATGDKVWVSNGVYYFSTIVTNSFSDFGGYASGVQTNVALLMITNGITVQSMNGPTITIIEGYQYGTYDSFAAKVVFLAYNSTLNGFTVRNGKPSGPKWFVNSGAGIRIHDGGAISNCIITSNRTSHGGGVAISSSSGGYVYNCVISNNEATSAGAGLYANGAGNGIIRDSIMCDNKAPTLEGGGIYLASTTLAVSNCVVTRNTGGSGAGVNIRSAGRVVNCQIVSNISSGGNNTGGIEVFGEGDGTATVLNNIISYNTGKGVCFSINAQQRDWLIVRNCLISSNSDYGAYFLNSVTNNYATIDNCTIVKNNKGIYQAIATTNPFTISNCIIFSNAPSDITLGNTITTNFYNSCATNNLPAPQGNIAGNPRFVELENANYRLRANSPCVNTGTNQSWMTNAVDLGGRTRIRYGTVDMGAYEVIYSGTILKF